MTDPLTLAHVHRAIDLLQHGQPRTARFMLSEVLRDSPDCVEARVNFALALEDCGQPADAEREYRTVLAKVPGHPDATLNLANLLIRLARVDEGAGLLEGLVGALTSIQPLEA